MKQYLICSLFLFSLFVEEGCSPTVNVENESLFPLPKETNQIKKKFQRLELEPFSLDSV